MTVLILRVVAVDEPLLQLTVAPDLHGRQLRQSLLIDAEGALVFAKNLGCLYQL